MRNEQEVTISRNAVLHKDPSDVQVYADELTYLYNSFQTGHYALFRFNNPTKTTELKTLISSAHEDDFEIIDESTALELSKKPLRDSAVLYLPYTTCSLGKVSCVNKSREVLYEARRSDLAKDHYVQPFQQNKPVYVADPEFDF